MNSLNKTKNSLTVAVGLSGGVDSSVAAGLLLKQGYRVIGLCMSISERSVHSANVSRHSCYSTSEAETLEPARSIADTLGIECFMIDLKKEFREFVLNHFKSEYLSGRTPNPCVRCNPILKFGLLPEKARLSGITFDLFATGHYIRNIYDSVTDRYLLKKAKYPSKDQSYFLYALKSDQLKDLMFPLGDFAKEAVRRMAGEMQLPVSSRPDSQDFAAGSYASLFDKNQVKPGNIIDPDGCVLGTHKGIIHYTVGQRKGIGIAAKEPLYVINISPDNNTITVGPRALLYTDILFAEDVNYVSIDRPLAPLKIHAKIRHNHMPRKAELIPLTDRTAKVVFNQPQLAVTRGQSVVFYKDDIVLGGGIIDRVIEHD